MTRRVRRYTAEQRVEAIGLAMSVGVLAAARQLGIPHRTVSHWARNPTPAMQAVIVESREAVADKLWQAVVAGTEAVLRGLQDPHARLSDKARALEVVSQQHALISGGVTSRSESANLTYNVGADTALTDEEARQLRTWLDTVDAATDDELREMAPAVRADMTRMLQPGSVEEVPDVG